MRRSCSGDVEVGASGSADDLAAVGVVGFGSGFDRGAELRIESNRDDFGGSRAEQRTPAAATLEGFGVVVSDGDLVGECVEVGFDTDSTSPDDHTAGLASSLENLATYLEP